MIRPDDKDRLRAGFQRMSPESRYLRFFGPKQDLSEAELRYLTEIDGLDHVAIGAARLQPDGREGDGLGVARFIRFPAEPDTAEAAIAVLDEVQGLGLGTILFMRLIAAAAERGVARFRCDVLGDNSAMVELIRSFAPDRTVHVSAGVVSIEFGLPNVAPHDVVAEAPRQSPLFRFFRLFAEGALEWRELVARRATRRRDGEPAAGTPDPDDADDE